MNISSSFARQGSASAGYLFMIIGVMLVGAIIATSLVDPLLRVLGTTDPYRALWAQSLGAIFMIGLPAWLTEFYHRRKTFEHLFAWERPSLRPMDWRNAIVLVVCGVVMSEVTIHVMEYIPAPFDWLVELEEVATREMERMLAGNDPLSWVLMLLALVIVAPITEELLFRGALMGWSIAKSGRIHMSVWLVAAVFSAVHMEWSGIPGRLIMGALLGYCAVYGGIRMAIVVHALNNLIALIGYKTMGEMAFTDGLSPALILLGLAAIVGIVYIIRNMHQNIHSKDLGNKEL